MKNNDLAIRIVDLREKKNITQTELAKKMDLDKSSMSKIENGTRKVSSDEVAKLANIFNVSTDYLLGRKELSKADQVHNATVDEALGTIMSFEGQPVTEHDKKVMKDLLESYLRNKE
ncbi:XRE family transcriptional regulator [Limosilactobacillus reuteri]|uniref:XRE family transcriptional regulator n=1 Tax=Limosilactobacillus reuteri TaxID=1598 RepID=A0A317GEC2_LIMRT|nr:helix-turn-helix transcriptional regulator [Limosilactobacillus reuteri]MCH5384658.1 helix-turn-helix domain-containing protein [Limosilactobacillus reuteri]OTA72739.1 transcriptional regulator [Limosilactobacillus reuteri]PWT45671.1 XRE family transcriptional regulator [Limosilactobacillus reuteri]PWT48429.1 XRE family transcriptional regulator [Limosilactobacillus reuteri]PWT61549.1 XRE family transcriptional regulator [Limosilactobacillus reuteri]